MADNYRHWKLETDGDNLVWLSFDKADATTNVLSAEVMTELDAILDELRARNPRGLANPSGKASGFISRADVEEVTRLEDTDDAIRLGKRGWGLFRNAAPPPLP